MTFRIRHTGARVLTVGILLCLLAGSLIGQPKPQEEKSAPPPQAPVTVNGKTLFTVRGVLSFTAAARADAISRRIHELSKDILFKPDSVTVADSEDSTDIMAGDVIVMSVTDQDAGLAKQSRQSLANDYAQRIRAALLGLRREYSLKSILLGVLYALIATSILLLIFSIFSRLFPKVYRTLNTWRGTRIRSVRIQRFEILPAHRITDFAVGLAKLLRFILVVIASYFYASLVLGFFPWTRGYAQVLVGYVLSPLRLIVDTAIAYLPNLFFILVIVLVSFYLVKFIKIIFKELGRGTITFQNFYPEWAEPTYKIVRFMIMALTLIIVFPYLPGAKSPAFQGISIFLGVLFSLGSTSAIANIVAGVILTYMRAFKIGDRVKIADTMGDVIEKTLLITRVRTIKNVEITIANAMVLGSHIINFSASGQQEGLVLHTTVTIGYDAPWRTVHQLLLDAALSTEGILKQPAPFILQTALDDFYVHYELNAYTDQPSRMAKIYSDLHANIQDKFNAAGVEIMSPHYSSVRDGNQIAIPEDHLPKGYTAPAFRLGVLDDVLDALKGKSKGTKE
ncbi:MAG TPA: mechanosensitive ion channel domain-containing protein [Terriglobales bacterium]|jgi:small-conductance mechanosensitive channel|nr:mechanosensitive ion channel domain-containing protein [Terriglobales bacterium]